MLWETVIRELDELLLAILLITSQQQQKFSLESSVEYSCEAVSYTEHLMFFTTVSLSIAKPDLCFCAYSVQKALSALTASQHSTN